MMNLTIADNLKKLRKERKLTQEDLAKFIGVSFQVISKWECGDSYPDIALLPVLAKFFNVTVDELLGAWDESSETAIESENKAFDMAVADLDLSVRTFNCLKRGGIATVKDLTQKTQEDIISLRNLSRRSFEEVVQKLNSYGLSLLNQK